MASAPGADRAGDIGPPRRFTITVLGPGDRVRTVEADADEYVLDAALRAGVELPYRCLQGWCLTCAARLVKGEVDQRDSRRYYEADREAGFALLCTARPRSDLVVQAEQREAMRRARAAKGLPFPKGDWGIRAPADRAGFSEDK